MFFKLLYKLYIPVKQDCGFITIAQTEYIKNFKDYKKVSIKKAVEEIINNSFFLNPEKNGGPREQQTNFDEILNKDIIKIEEIGKGMIPVNGFNEKYIEKIENHLVNQLKESCTAALLVSNGSDLQFENKQNDKLDEVWKNIQQQKNLIGCGHWSTLIKNNNKLFIVKTVQVENGKEQMISFRDFMKETMSGNNIKKVVSIIPLNDKNLKKINDHNFLV